MLETPVENPPPVLETVELPEYARAYCDKWGNIKKTPEKVIEQNKAADFVKIFIYNADPGFYFGFQLKIRKLIYQREANILKDTAQDTAEAATYAARRELVALVNSYSKKMIEAFLTFDKICYNQPELF